MVSFSLLGLQHPEPNGSRRATPTSTFQHRPGHPHSDGSPHFLYPSGAPYQDSNGTVAEHLARMDAQYGSQVNAALLGVPSDKFPLPRIRGEPQPNVDLARGSYFRDLGQPHPPPLSGDLKIRRLQTQLQSQGFDPGPIDGIDGPRTQAALAARRQQERANIANTPPIPGLRPDVPLPRLRPDQTQPLPRPRPAVDRPFGNNVAPVPAAAATAAVPPISAQPNLNPTTIGTLYSQNYEADLREAGVGRAESAVPTYGRLHHGSVMTRVGRHSQRGTLASGPSRTPRY